MKQRPERRDSAAVTRPRWELSATGLCVLALLVGSRAEAQITIAGSDLDEFRNPVRISGEVGMYGELYGMSGRDSRRPPVTGRIYFRPVITIANAATFSFDLLLSTEGSSALAGQQINQLGVRPAWSWGYANAGDFSEAYTPLTLNGLLIRGGSVTINPGLFRFSALGGYTRRSAYGSSSGRFDRYLYGGRIGIGSNEESHIDLQLLRTRDIPSKFELVTPDSIPSPDSTQVGTPVASTQEAPQENLVIGASGALHLLEKRLRIQGEINGSVFTRDMTSAELDAEKIPSAARGLYTPRVSSYADLAYTVAMNLALSPVALRAAYRSIGPGYTSLGVASLIADQREILLGANIHSSGWTASLTWARQNDNLLGQKLYTTVRHRYSGSAMVRPLSVWNATVHGNLLRMGNSAPNDTALVRFLTLAIGTSQTVMFDRGTILQTVSVNYNYQKSADENPLREGSRSHAHTISATAVMAFSEQITVVPSVSLVASRVAFQPGSSITTYSLTPRYRSQDGAFVASLTLGLSRSRSVNSLVSTLRARYRLTDSSSLTLTYRRTGFRNGLQPSINYDENVASLVLKQSF